MTKRRNDRTGGSSDRPDPLTDLERALLAEGRRLVTVRDGGEPVEISVNEIIARKTAETAAKGSPHAQRTWLNATAEAVARENSIKDENAAFWRLYQRSYRSEIALARKRGEPLPEPVPHPDDIVIDDRNNISVDGPVTELEAQVYAYIVNQREAFMRQHVLDKKRGNLKGDMECAEGFGSAMMMVSLTNMVLPPRLRLDETAMWRLYCGFRSQTIRQLLKDDHRAWKRLHLPSRRGSASPDLGAFIRLLAGLGAIAADHAASPGTDRDIDRALARTVALTEAAAPVG
ncbi:MAG: DUF5681 domain-containing protein [Proteobacteria bacterium]|nr:DUF5681 domain-containing protein [Pseudomonadota bacterium]